MTSTKFHKNIIRHEILSNFSGHSRKCGKQVREALFGETFSSTAIVK
jgi:hypothetical protein